MNALNLNAVRIQMPREQEGQQLVLGRMMPAAWISIALICVMAATLISLSWFPVVRALSNVQVNPNEGWNTYRAAMAANTIPLYGTSPGHFTGSTCYPPLSFHLIGGLGRGGDFNAAGRWVSLVSFVAAGVFVALIVRRAGGGAGTALFSFLLYEIGIAVLTPNYIAMNDPQLLAEALCVLGFYFYVRYQTGAKSDRVLCLSALAFCLAGFTKQNLIAFPLVVAIDLLLRSRKEFATWAGTLLLCAGLFTSLTILVDGPHFYAHLMSPRAYLYREAWSNIHEYLLEFQFPVLFGAAWSIGALRTRGVFASAFFASHLVAFLLAGGDGVNLNILFNAWAAAAIVCGIALADILSERSSSPAMPVNRYAYLGLMLAFSVGLLIHVPSRLLRSRNEAAALQSQAYAFRSVVDSVQGHPGPALCQSLLVCFEAGKPYEFDVFWVSDGLRTGRLREDEVNGLLRTHYFQTVQIGLLPEEKNQTSEIVKNRPIYYTRNFMEELLENYRVSVRTSEMVVFVPKDHHQQ